MGKSNKFFYIFSVLIFSILLIVISGCNQNNADNSDVVIDETKDSAQNTGNDDPNLDDINDISEDAPSSNNAQNLSQNVSLLEEINETSIGAFPKTPCITNYPMFYTDSKGVYRSTELKLENFSLTPSVSESTISIFFGARMETVDPTEERYSRVGGYNRHLPNDESACTNPEWIFNTLSIAFCNITQLEPDTINKKKYQGEILVYNHSVPGCFANHTSQRRVWLSCGPDSTTTTCVVPASSDERFSISASQKSEDEIARMSVRINYGDSLPTGFDFRGYDMRYQHYTYSTVVLSTDSMAERTYNLEIELTLKNGKKEKYERQLRISSPSTPGEFRYDPDCFSTFTLTKNIPAYVGNYAVTLKYIFKYPQMVYLDTNNHIPQSLAYGTERISGWSKITFVDFENQQITLQNYDPSCKGNVVN